MLTTHLVEVCFNLKIQTSSSIYESLSTFGLLVPSKTAKNARHNYFLAKAIQKDLTGKKALRLDIKKERLIVKRLECDGSGYKDVSGSP